MLSEQMIVRLKMDVAFTILPSDDFEEKTLKRQNFIDRFTLECFL